MLNEDCDVILQKKLQAMITILILAVFIYLIFKLFTTKEDLRRMEEEEKQEIRRENGYGKRILNR